MHVLVCTEKQDWVEVKEIDFELNFLVSNCASVTSLVHGDFNFISLLGLLWGLNEWMFIEGLEIAYFTITSFSRFSFGIWPSCIGSDLN